MVLDSCSNKPTHENYNTESKTNQPETKILLQTENEIKLAVHAPPAEGKANQEIIKFLSKYFKSNIQIVRGKTSKIKVIKIET